MKRWNEWGVRECLIVQSMSTMEISSVNLGDARQEDFQIRCEWMATNQRWVTINGMILWPRIKSLWIRPETLFLCFVNPRNLEHAFTTVRLPPSHSRDTLFMSARSSSLVVAKVFKSPRCFLVFKANSPSDLRQTNQPEVIYPSLYIHLYSFNPQILFTGKSILRSHSYSFLDSFRQSKCREIVTFKYCVFNSPCIPFQLTNFPFAFQNDAVRGQSSCIKQQNTGTKLSINCHFFTLIISLSG